jgi:hypothetical protein
MGGGIQRGDLKILEELSFVSSIRGTDATGVVFGNSHARDPRIFKVAGDPFYFNFMARDVKDYDNVFNNYFIGHTRSATVGDRTHRGAHPYQYGNLVGAHNGTIGSYHKLDGFPTDSAKLYSSINEIGLQATLDTLDDRDALALVWYDTKRKTVNFFSSSILPRWVGKKSTTAIPPKSSCFQNRRSRQRLFTLVTKTSVRTTTTSSPPMTLRSNPLVDTTVVTLLVGFPPKLVRL